MTKHFQLLEHTADVKLKATGATAEEALAVLVAGFADYQKPEKEKLIQGINRSISVNFSHRKFLPADLLNEIIFLQEENKELYPQISGIKIGTKNFSASLTAAKALRRRLDVKAATYNDIVFEKKGREWVIEVVTDV